MDQEFLNQCIAGNRKAQQQLYKLHAPRLYAVCLRYMGDEESAKDILQEVFITIFKNLDGFQQKGSFEGWLYRIAVNTSLTFIRKQKKLKDQTSLSSSPIQIEESKAADVLSVLSQQEIMALIQELPDGFREVINLYIIDGYSHKEISELLDITVDNSKQRLRRGRVILQKNITKLYRIPDEKHIK